MCPKLRANNEGPKLLHIISNHWIFFSTQFGMMIGYVCIICIAVLLWRFCRPCRMFSARSVFIVIKILMLMRNIQNREGWPNLKCSDSLDTTKNLR